MNRKRDIHHKVDLVMETGQAELLSQIIGVLYESVLLKPDEDGASRRPTT